VDPSQGPSRQVSTARMAPSTTTAPTAVAPTPAGERLAITTQTLPTAKAAASYPSTRVQASGARGTVSFAVTSGKLPSGLTLNADGTLSGMPSAMASGLYPLTITARDDSNAVTATLTLYVEGVLEFTPPAGSVLSARENVAFSQKITARGGFSQEYNEWRVSDLGRGLPAGLKLTVSPDFSATISGTPAPGSAGTYDVYIYVNEVFAGSPVDSYLKYTITVGRL
jgi:large repetitive protein